MIGSGSSALDGVEPAGSSEPVGAAGSAKSARPTDPACADTGSVPAARRGPVQTAAAMLDAVRDRDLDTVLDCFDPAEDTYVYLEGPRWTNRGGPNIYRGWRAYFAAPIELRSWGWTEGPYEYLSDSLALVAGVIHYDFLGGGQQRRLPMRMTWVLRRGADGAWRIVHEHGSQPLPDPYGTGDWLPAGEVGGAPAAGFSG